MTPEEIAAIRARVEAATLGPWERDSYSLRINAVDVPKGPMHIADIRGWGYLTGKGHALALPDEEAIAIQRANAEFIAAARTDVPVLLQHIDDMTAKLATARADAMEVACSAVCRKCRDGIPFKKQGNFLHEGDIWTQCEGVAIRKAFVVAEEEAP